MKDIVALEGKKLLSRKDIMVALGILLVVPFLFSFCIVNEIAGLNFGGTVARYDYGVLIWTFLKYLFVLYLIPLHMVTSMLGKEVENRSIQIMLSNKTRMSVLLGKVIIYLVAMTIFFVLFQIACALSFELFVAKTEYAQGIEASFMKIFFLYLFQWLEVVFTIGLAVLLSCVIKGNAALVFGLVFVVLERIFVNINGIKHFIPYYISDSGAYEMVRASKLLTHNIQATMTYVVIIGILTFVSVRIWKKRDF